MKKENKLCLVCNIRERHAGKVYCKGCAKTQEDVHLMDLDVNVHEYPSIFEYKRQ